MKIVVLFGGGDNGGLIITENGVRPIPQFDPAIRKNLKSAAAMVNATTSAAGENSRRKMAKLATSLCNLAVEQVEEVVGPLDAERSLIFQDDDGGFVCGSTGKPPIPLPWPPGSIPSVHDLVAAGTIEPELVELVLKAKDSKVKLIDVFEKPIDVAKKLGVKLPEKSANDIHMFAPSRLAGIKDETDREIIEFFHKVAEDGRYLETWFTRPYEVSHALNVKLSEPALERLVTRGAAVFMRRGDASLMGPIIVVGVGILLVIAACWGFCDRRRIEEIVRDRSGIAKI